MGLSKHFQAFARNSRTRDGYGPCCKPCRKTKYGDPAVRRGRAVVRHFDGTQQCRLCGQDRPVTDFHWRSDQGKYRSECKPCKGGRDRAAWPTKQPARRDQLLRSKYGISADEFDETLAAQGGGCRICGRDSNPDSKSLAVDHCHTTGRVRGILCGPCNKALGLMSDNPELLRLAADYLENGGD